VTAETTSTAKQCEFNPRTNTADPEGRFRCKKQAAGSCAGCGQLACERHLKEHCFPRPFAEAPASAVAKS
jgi:hypothetical protein